MGSFPQVTDGVANEGGGSNPGGSWRGGGYDFEDIPEDKVHNGSV